MVISTQHLLFDAQGGCHTFELEKSHLDGVTCTELTLDGAHIHLITAQGSVTCTLEQFWRAVAGPDPTPTEAGRLLAQCMVQQLHLTSLLATFQDLDALWMRTAALAQKCALLDVTWLSHRLDPLTRQAMAAFDGSRETTDLLARILGQESATILAWAVELGYQERLPSTGPLVTGSPAVAEFAGEGSGGTKQQHFQWTEARKQQLAQAQETCEGNTVAERARQIASAHDWPLAAVRSKLYEMQRSQRHDQVAARESESAADEQEGDQRDDQRAVAPV